MQNRSEVAKQVYPTVPSLDSQKWQYLLMPSITKEQLIDQGGPVIWAKGEGCTLTDINGKSYIDALSGVWVVNVGHGRKEIRDAIFRQAEQLEYVLVEEGYANIPAITLAVKLAEMTPGKLTQTFFTCGGSEAVESALKIMRQYHLLKNSQARYKVLFRRYSYHGSTYAAMSITGFKELSAPFFVSQLVRGSKQVSHPYCYRCEFGLEYPACELRCVEAVEQSIQREGPETVGAVIAEPISASCGAAVPPDDYWPRLREICDKYGVLLIADEVITGFGRTGKMFGCEHWNVTPDLMVVGKGLTSGYQPLSAVIVRQEIAKQLETSGFSHGFTYSGHPIACAAALANLKILEQEDLVANAAKMGDYLLSQLQTALADSPIVGDIRGKGLLCAVEIVKDRKTKQQFPPDAQVGTRLKKFFIEHGLYCRTGNQIQLGPPLIITKDEIDQIATIIHGGIKWLSTQI